MNKKLNDDMSCTVKSIYFKKVISMLLSILMITSILLSPMNIIYAADNGEYVIKSISHPESVRTVVEGNNVTIILPFNDDSDSLDLSNINLTAATNFRLTQKEFPSGSVAETGGPSSIMDVYYIYTTGDDKTTQFSTRYYINVNRGEAPTFSGTISMNTSLQKNIVLNYSDFINFYDSNDGEDMGSISIGTTNNSVGTLKFKGSVYKPDTRITVTDIASGNLIFEPLTAGTASYKITAYDDDENETNCGYAVLNIKVEYPVSSDITFNGTENNVLLLSSSKFTDACTQTVGGTLDYIKIPTLPSSSYGKLYIDYVSSSYGSLVTAGTNYNKTSIDKMAFVPYPEYFGDFFIPFNGYNTDGEIFTGKIKIVVIENRIDASTIKYSTYENTPVNFESNDFVDECEDTTGESLDYVKLTLPSSSKGTLYVNYASDSSYGSKISSTTKYYENDLDDITFAPYSDYYGTVIISYVGYNDDGEDYTGEIEITVTEVDIDADPIIYETGSYTPLTFEAYDFQDACDDVTNEDLDYVRFTVPSSSYGVMYTDYTSSTRYGSKVSSGTKYYEEDLDSITFVPKSAYTGTVIISYTGYNDDGDSFTGVVKITVEKENPVADAINISTKEDISIRFDDGDFNDASEDTTDEELDYVKFTLPSSSSGKLYYNYSTASNYDSLVSSSTKYYYDDSPSLSKVTFVPNKNYYGTVTIKYTGYNLDGEAFTGSIKIEVASMPETEGSIYFNDVTKDYYWAASQIDYLYEEDIVNGTGNSNYSPAQNMSRGDFILMLYRALDLSATTSGNFSDVPKDSYYYKAIATAKALGIAKGFDNQFMPSASITREDAFVLVARALKVDGKKLSAGDYDDLSAFKDRKSVSDYAVTSVATLVKSGIVQGSNSNLNPKAFISRAEMAVILYRVLEL